MPTVEVEVSVWCARCGAGLCNQSDGTKKGRETGVSVEPCQKCLDKEHLAGYDEGYDEARGAYERED